jgi:hypothetical protein
MTSLLHLKLTEAEKGENEVYKNKPMVMKCKDRKCICLMNTIHDNETEQDQDITKNESLFIHLQLLLTNSVAPEPEGSSPHSQQPATSPYPPPTLSPQHPF